MGVASRITSALIPSAAGAVADVSVHCPVGLRSGRESHGQSPTFTVLGENRPRATQAFHSPFTLSLYSLPRLHRISVSPEPSLSSKAMSDYVRPAFRLSSSSDHSSSIAPASFPPPPSSHSSSTVTEHLSVTAIIHYDPHLNSSASISPPSTAPSP